MRRLLPLAVSWFVCLASAQSYPAKPVKLIVSYPPGGSSDLMARVFGAKLAEMWGQQVVVENKPGAAGSIGTDYAAKQPPDGYSFMIANLGPIAVNPLLSSVPYKGGVLAVQDLLGGQIQFIFSDSLPAMAHIRAGKLRALCITGAEPFALLPELPTCQAAAPGLVAVNWWGVLMPAGTPRAIVARFHGDTVKTLADPGVKKKFADLGVEAVSSTPEQFAAFIRTEMDKYGKLIKEANIKDNP